jgi:hypothetical protein
MNIIGESKIIENLNNRRQQQKIKIREDGKLTIQ